MSDLTDVVAALMSAGFTYEQAWALALSGPGTVFIVPLDTTPRRTAVSA